MQNPGVKFQWAPVIVGTEGNGKSTILRHLTEAVGKRYTHFPNAQKLDSSFNAWVSGKLLIGIEEIQAGRNHAIMEALKPLITNPMIQVEPKGIDAYMMDNVANFVLLSNYRDAVRKTADDRRYAVIYCAQQSMQDNLSFGLTSEYFVQYYHWLENGGFEIVTNFLHNYQPEAEFNPAQYCRTAPVTSSTYEAIEYTRTHEEQMVVQAILDEEPGFKGGWISSTALNTLLDTYRGRPMHNRAKSEMIRRLGYDTPPQLPYGKSSRRIIEAPEAGRRPILYLKTDLIYQYGQYDGNTLTQLYINAQATP